MKKLTLTAITTSLGVLSSIAVLTTLTSCNEEEKFETKLTQDEFGGYLEDNVHKISDSEATANSADDPTFLTTLKNGINGQNLLNACVFSIQDGLWFYEIYEPILNNAHVLTSSDSEIDLVTISTIYFNTPTENHIRTKIEQNDIMSSSSGSVDMKLSLVLDLTINEDKTISGSLAITGSLNGRKSVSKSKNIDKWVLSQNKKEISYSDNISNSYFVNMITYVKPGVSTPTEDDEFSLQLSGKMNDSTSTSVQDTEGLTFYRTQV
ncbi:MAG: hypothetical protein LBC44_00240 [Mycoplasmataceae bacterium]|nr:hypothetical protein [Mycoplasmataceae bacterium]